MIGLPMAYHAGGRKAESDAALAALIAKYETHATYNIAGVHAFAARPIARSSGSSGSARTAAPSPRSIVLDPLFANLSEDPRWIPFLRSIGKGPEQLATISFNVTPPESDAAAVVAADRVAPRHSPSTTAPWHFRASRRPFLFATLTPPLTERTAQWPAPTP